MMSRQINVNDPESWDDDDRTYLRDRVESVPVEHRHHLIESVPASPVQTFDDVNGTAASMAALTQFVNKHYPDELGAPVEVVMRRLTELDDLHEPDEDATDDYDSWKGPELKAEIGRREIEFSGRTKAEAIAALRADDAAKREAAEA